MRVIFFGCGYLGYNLSTQLSKSFDTEIWGIDSPYAPLAGKFVQVDVFNTEEMAGRDLEGAVIVDTIGLVSNDAVSEDDALTLEPVREKYRKLFRLLRDKKIRRYVYFSSGGTIYGDSLEPIDEGHVIHPVTLYAKSKEMLEGLLQESQLDYLILRPANPYGGYQVRGKRQGVIPILITKALKREPFTMWTDGGSIRDYIYIDDFARALRLLIAKDVSCEIVNIASGQGTSLNEVIRIVEEATGRKIPIEHASSQVPVVEAIVLDIGKLKRLTGYEPTVSLNEGIRLETQRIEKEDQPK